MYEFLNYRVRDAMVPDPVCVRIEQSVGEVQGLFERHSFNGLPVVDEHGDLVGFVTKLDVLRAFRLTPDYMVPDYDETMLQAVGHIMSCVPITVGPEDPLTLVLEKLVQLRFKSLPVVESGRLCGIIAREDVLSALRRGTGQALQRAPV